MTAAQGKLNMIYAGRAVAGLGIGASSMTVPVYIAEIAPPSVRGRLIGIFEIASQGGGMLGFWINYACDRTIDVETQTQWVVPLAIQLIPGLLLLMGVAWCPEFVYPAFHSSLAITDQSYRSPRPYLPRAPIQL